MINLFSSNESKLQKSQDYNSLHEKPKSLLRALVQKLFLTLLLRFFPKKFLSYKNKIKFIMDRGGYLLRLYLTCTYLRFRHPLYFKLPSTQLYAISLAIKFLKILKPQKIDFFLVGGSLLGAVRQESFAGRPSDIDLGIKEDQLPKLLNAIPLLMKSGARFVRTRPHNKPERLQIIYPGTLVDIAIYRKKNVDGKEMWGNADELMYKYNKNWVEKIEKDYVRKLDYFTFSLDSLTPIKVYGREFLAPPNPEIYLEKKFGKNWRIFEKKQFCWSKKIKS